MVWLSYSAPLPSQGLVDGAEGELPDGSAWLCEAYRGATIPSATLNGKVESGTVPAVGRGGRQKAATRRNIRREERVTDCPGPRKKTTTRRNVTQGAELLLQPTSLGDCGLYFEGTSRCLLVFGCPHCGAEISRHCSWCALY